jgi:hypothetical protein
MIFDLHLQRILVALHGVFDGLPDPCDVTGWWTVNYPLIDLLPVFEEAESLLCLDVSALVPEAALTQLVLELLLQLVCR